MNSVQIGPSRELTPASLPEEVVQERGIYSSRTLKPHKVSDFPFVQMRASPCENLVMDWRERVSPIEEQPKLPEELNPRYQV